MLIIAGIVCVFIRNSPANLDRAETDLDGKAAAQSEPSVEVPVFHWTGVIKSFPVWYLGIVYFFYGFSYIIYMTFFAAYLVKEIGLSQEWAGGVSPSLWDGNFSFL